MKFLTFLALASFTFADTPPKPEHYFNDYTGRFNKEAGIKLNRDLAEFDKATTNQFVVAIYPTLDTDSSVEDFCNRTAKSWKAGQKDKNNGVVFFIFLKDSNGKGKMRIEVGYGLEGVLPDGTCKRILMNAAGKLGKEGFTKTVVYVVTEVISKINAG